MNSHRSSTTCQKSWTTSKSLTISSKSSIDLACRQAASQGGVFLLCSGGVAGYLSAHWQSAVGEWLNFTQQRWVTLTQRYSGMALQVKDDPQDATLFFNSVWFSRNPLEILCTEFSIQSITAADHSSSGIADLRFCLFSRQAANLD